MTIAAATRWVSIRSALVVGAAGASTSGTSDSAVSTTVVRTNVLRGWRATRAMTAAMTTPISEKNAVSVPKPRTGIGAPPMSRLMPTIVAAAATTGVAARATTVARMPVPKSAEVPAGALVMVAVMVFSDEVATGPVPVSHLGYERDRRQST